MSKSSGEAVGAAGAVALRLMIWNGYGMERYRPPRRTGVSASTLMGAHGPGSSLPAAEEKQSHCDCPKQAQAQAQGSGRGLSREIVPLARFLFLDSPTCLRKLTLA
ncbi:MAG TPA: hypothetical protein DD397_11750 [Hyphomonas sp.]|nr:hypothetical protein [Hyphomonas sp.]MAX84735.1 hypothetical protein [Hyphomonas sp.]HBN93230.1 hypothetical protein [Hyphomonas sp.]